MAPNGNCVPETLLSPAFERDFQLTTSRRHGGVEHALPDIDKRLGQP